MRTLLKTLTATALALAACANPLDACTNILVTKGASKDRAPMISYSADSHSLYGELYFKAGGRHHAGTMREIFDWDAAPHFNKGKRLGAIPEAPVTYTRVGNMNEHQVVIGETTFGGRKELAGPSGIIDYGSLIYIALERAKTAREAIQVMTDLVAEHGYASSGESFSIADKNEVWIMEMIGKGKDQKGAVWIAWRIPDGMISGHANAARIRQIALNDPANCLYAKDLVSFARSKGWYKGEDKDFSFADVYAPSTFGSRRGCDGRVWSVFNRAAKGANVSIDWAKAVPGAKPMPLWVKPDKPLGVKDVMELMRDHFTGTEFDMTQDVGAGPFELPYRWRPMGFKADGADHVHERAISTQQTAWSYVSQSRGELPDAIGGVLWFGVDDTYTTCYFPMYAGVRSVPTSWAEGTGSFDQFSWDSAHWVFNAVSNWTYSRWSDMIQDVQKVQRELEGRYLAEQPEVDAQALALYKQNPGLARDFLTAYSTRQGEELVARWRKLGEHLMWKYMDGNVRTNEGHVTHPPYRKAWTDRIGKELGDRNKVRPIVQGEED